MNILAPLTEHMISGPLADRFLKRFDIYISAFRNYGGLFDTFPTTAGKIFKKSGWVFHLC